jgi:hypothetical protein
MLIALQPLKYRGIKTKGVPWTKSSEAFINFIKKKKIRFKICDKASFFRGAFFNL